MRQYLVVYDIELFIDDAGVCPFKKWLDGLSDTRAKAKILERLRRASDGNFGDWKRLVGTEGIFEMREHYGAGFRIYYSIIGQKLVVILAGGTKKDQDKDNKQPRRKQRGIKCKYL